MALSQAHSSARLQRALAAHLRNPAECPAPEGIEDRRLKIYRDLVYNNVERFIANGFPVLRKLYTDDDWHALVRDFLIVHRARSPYFLQIGAEFVAFLESGRRSRACDPPFLLELATYEWAELALFVSDELLPPAHAESDTALLDAIPRLSPLAWPLVFAYPVHKIGVDFQPQQPEPVPVCLVVYRNRGEKVKFLEINPATARLLEICDEHCGLTARQILQQVAAEMPGSSLQRLLEAGEGALAQLRNLDIIHFQK